MDQELVAWEVILNSIVWLSISRFILVVDEAICNELGGVRWPTYRQRFRRAGVHIFFAGGVTVFQSSRNPALVDDPQDSDQFRQQDVWERARQHAQYDGEMWIYSECTLTESELDKLRAQLARLTQGQKIFVKRGRNRKSVMQLVFRRPSLFETPAFPPSAAEIPYTMPWTARALAELFQEDTTGHIDLMEGITKTAPLTPPILSDEDVFFSSESSEEEATGQDEHPHYDTGYPVDNSYTKEDKTTGQVDEPHLNFTSSGFGPYYYPSSGNNTNRQIDAMEDITTNTPLAPPRPPSCPQHVSLASKRPADCGLNTTPSKKQKLAAHVNNPVVVVVAAPLENRFKEPKEPQQINTGSNSFSDPSQTDRTPQKSAYQAGDQFEEEVRVHTTNIPETQITQAVPRQLSPEELLQFGLDDATYAKLLALFFQQQRHEDYST